jgi:hypothetical protein
MALLALIGMILMAVLLVRIFVSSVIYVLRDVETPVALFASFIHALGCFRVVVFFSCSQKRSGSRDFGAVGYAVLGSSQHPFYPFAGIRLPGGMGSGGRLSSPMVSRGCGVYWPVCWAIWA